MKAVEDSRSVIKLYHVISGVTAVRGIVGWAWSAPPFCDRLKLTFWCFDMKLDCFPLSGQSPPRSTSQRLVHIHLPYFVGLRLLRFTLVHYGHCLASLSHRQVTRFKLPSPRPTNYKQPRRQRTVTVRWLCRSRV